MRNVFLALVLANLFLLAWHIWVDPDWQMPAPGSTAGTLELFAPVPGPASSVASMASAMPATGAESPIHVAAGDCLRVGPLPDGEAVQQAAAQLTARGFAVSTVARDGQVWLGHWVQIASFDSVPAAEQARQRLVAAGIQDAYLMQEGSRPIVSLGVFRERDRADNVASAARALGFNVSVRARYRPVVEQWLLLEPPAGQAVDRSMLNLGSDRIVRIEATTCEPEPIAGSGAEGP